MRIRPMSSTLHRPRARMCAWTEAFLLLVVCASAASGPGAVRTEVQLVGFGSSFGPANVRPVPSRSGVDSFSITGNVVGLFPGKTLPLVLSVSNRRSFAITVTSITTTVGNPSSRCTAKYLKVTTFAGHLRVRAKKTAKTTVKVTLSHAAPNACQKAVFHFTYHGRATVR